MLIGNCLVGLITHDLTTYCISLNTLYWKLIIIRESHEILPKN